MPQPQRFFTPAQIRAQPRWPAQPGMGGAPRPQQMAAMGMARPGMAPRPGAPRMSGAPPAARPQMMQPGGPQARGPQPSFQYTKTARNPPMQGMPGQAVVA